ncbi:MAG: hypothetical protein H6839_16415 [Planctomycetes bacterium]|nr:hypothetical protein [Planctomycetota bacterium]
MEATDFNDAFLDSTYLKLDEGALSFIFTPARVKAATALSVEQANLLVQDNHDALVKIYGDTTKRILIEPFYMELFEELAEQPDDVAFAFINLALRRVEDERVEAARVAEVKKYQAKRKPKA